MKKVGIIGAGISGLSSACFLAKGGYDVTVFEQNDSAGGRARKFESQGFTFDMGPSWYWMPDVFESFFKHFGKVPSDYYQLERLDPSYRVFYSKEDVLDIPAGLPALGKLFEEIEPGGGIQLDRFIQDAKDKYELGLKHQAYKPGISLLELADIGLLKNAFKLNLFSPVSHHVRKYFKDPRLIRLLEFPVLFLGAAPQKTPALYTLMNYADMGLGTWYPKGGMYQVIEGMVALARSLGVKFKFNSAVQQVVVSGKRASALLVKEQTVALDYVVAAADYHHVEQNLLPASHRNYSAQYWEGREMAPSALIFYLGIKKPLIGLRHHNLFFDQDLALHTREIYDYPEWPTNPLFYVCCSSKSDVAVAPPGHENVFILIPVAPDLHDDTHTRKKYFDLVIDRIEKLTGQSVKEHIVYTRTYAHRDFISDYNAFKGNAYGLANTLSQTANLKPSIVNKMVVNLFYAGQLTVPGPGVPPAIISGQLASTVLMKMVSATRAKV